MRRLLLSSPGVESPDTESKEGAAQRAAGVALRGARETPGHTHARARRTGVGPTSVPAPLGLYPRWQFSVGAAVYNLVRWRNLGAQQR